MPVKYGDGTGGGCSNYGEIQTGHQRIQAGLVLKAPGVWGATARRVGLKLISMGRRKAVT